jgi:hypothetical protein
MEPDYMGKLKAKPLALTDITGKPIAKSKYVSIDHADALMPPPIAVQRSVKLALSAKPKLPFKAQQILPIARLIAVGQVPNVEQVKGAIAILSNPKTPGAIAQLLGGTAALKWLKATQAQATAESVRGDAGEECGASFIQASKTCRVGKIATMDDVKSKIKESEPLFLANLDKETDKVIAGLGKMKLEKLEYDYDPDSRMIDVALPAAYKKTIKELKKGESKEAHALLDEFDFDDFDELVPSVEKRLGKNLEKVEQEVSKRIDLLTNKLEEIDSEAEISLLSKASTFTEPPKTFEEWESRQKQYDDWHGEAISKIKEKRQADLKEIGKPPDWDRLGESLEMLKDQYSSDPDDWNMDSFTVLIDAEGMAIANQIRSQINAD